MNNPPASSRETSSDDVRGGDRHPSLATARATHQADTTTRQAERATRQARYATRLSAATLVVAAVVTVAWSVHRAGVGNVFTVGWWRLW